MTDDTAAIQAEIDAAAATGGGRVTLQAGRTYYCGSLRLRSGIELHLEPGSRLVAAARIDQFAKRFVVGALASGVSADSSEATAALLWAEDAEDVSVTGSGVIDGSAHAYVLADRGDIFRMSNARPFPLFFIGCRRVTLSGVRFVDAALWTVRLSGCDGVTIVGLRIDNDMRVPNADGIDIDHCRRVQIIGCDVRCPDDGISLKTTDEFARFGACEDVVITGCTIESGSTAVTLGVDTECPIRNVVVSSCVIRNSHRGVSVSVGSGPGGSVENVLFSDLVIETRHAGADWWGSGEPIVVRSAPWHDKAGPIRVVRFRNILARAENGILLYAGGGGQVDDVVLCGVRLELNRWTDHPGRRIDLRPFDHAPRSAQLPAGIVEAVPAAVHVEGVSDVRLDDVRVRRGPQASEFGPTLRVLASDRVTWRGLVSDREPTADLVIDDIPGPLEPEGAV